MIPTVYAVSSATLKLVGANVCASVPCVRLLAQEAPEGAPMAIMEVARKGGLVMVLYPIENSQGCRVVERRFYFACSYSTMLETRACKSEALAAQQTMDCKSCMYYDMRHPMGMWCDLEVAGHYWP